MSNFQFKEQEQEVKNLCKESLELLGSRKEQQIKRLISDFEQFLLEYQQQVKLTIGFIGQYSSGKSTMIAALTDAKFIEKYLNTLPEPLVCLY